jgi:Tol biopolymer transport system component
MTLPVFFHVYEELPMSPSARRARSRQKAIRSSNRSRRRLIAGIECLEARTLMATDVLSVAAFPSSTAGGSSYQPSLSGDGRYLVFESAAANLVPGDVNANPDIFLKDMQTGALTLVSADSNGVQGNSYSVAPSLSRDGRYVAFSSGASNLISGDTNDREDVFVKDLQTGAIRRVSTGSSESQSRQGGFEPAISADGRYVAFTSFDGALAPGDTNSTWDIFVKDLQTGTVTRVSTDSSGGQGDSYSSRPSISSDGRFVAFHSYATNFVAGDDNGTYDVFVKDLQTGTLTLASATNGGGLANGYSQFPSLSSDGRYVTFESNATNLAAGATDTRADVYVKDLQTGTITLVSAAASGTPGAGNSQRAKISADGRYVAFESYADNLVPGDYNLSQDVFVKDLQTGAVTRLMDNNVTAPRNSNSYQPSISADGRVVAFTSFQPNLVVGDSNGASDIFVTDTQSVALQLITPALPDSGVMTANHRSEQPSASADGRYVVFKSEASNLIVGDTNGVSDIFLKDTLTGAFSRQSTSSTGAQANGLSDDPSINASGRYIVFASAATNLVTGDTNRQADVFIKDTVSGAITRVSTDGNGVQANGPSSQPTVSGDGRYVAFRSLASNLVAGDTNNTWDIFVKDMLTGTTVRINLDSAGLEANGSAELPKISTDGRFLTFASDASNLVAGDSNGAADIFLKDLTTGAISRVSTDSGGAQANAVSQQPAISADGRYVAFASSATNLAAGDTNGAMDVFVKDTYTGLVKLLSRTTDGVQAKYQSTAPSISEDGRFVSFAGWFASIPNSIGVFVNDTTTGELVCVTPDIVRAQAISSLGQPVVSGDGRFVTFACDAPLMTFDGNEWSDVFRTRNPFGDQAPVVVNGEGEVDEDHSLLIDLRLQVSDETADDALTYSILNATNGSMLATATPGVYEFTPDADFYGTAVITFGVADNYGESNLSQGSFVVTVKPVNDPPTLDPLIERAIVGEDAGPHQLNISGISAGRNESQLVQITAISSAPELIPHPQVSYSLASGSGTITFQPNPNASGSTVITVRMTDAGEDGVLGNEDDAFLEQTFAITVTAVNDAPVLDTTVVPALIAVREDNVNSYGSPVWMLLGGMSDIDANALRGAAIIGQEGTSNGYWLYTLDGGAHWQTLPEVSRASALLLPANGNSSRVRFVPKANFHGQAKLQVIGWDQTQGTAGDLRDLSAAESTGGNTGFSLSESTATLEVTPLNDAPQLSLQTSPSLVSIQEDNRKSYGTPIWMLAQGITDADGSAAQRGLAITSAETANGSWQYTLDGGATWQSLGSVISTSARLLPANGNLSRIRFVPNNDFHGKAVIGYFAWDQTQGSAGDVVDISGFGQRGGSTAFSTTSRSSSLTIAPVNDRPLVNGSGSIGYQQNAAPVVLASSATVRDVDHANFAGGYLLLKITSGADASNWLTVGGAFKVVKADGALLVMLGDLQVGTLFNDGFGTRNLRVNFNANATPAIAHQLLRSIMFRTVGATSSQPTPRVVSIVLNDGRWDGTSLEMTCTVNITP